MWWPIVPSVPVRPSWVGGLGELERNYRARVLKCSGAAPSESAKVRGGDLLLVHVAAGDLPALLKAAQG